MLKQQQEQRQKLAIDVQQIQQIKLLEVSGEELADRIREELATNPALEVVEESEETTPEDNFLDEEPLSPPENEQEGIQDDFSPEDYTADDEREDARASSLALPLVTMMDLLMCNPTRRPLSRKISTSS